VLRIGIGWQSLGVWPRCGLIGEFCQTEIKNLGMTTFGYEYIGWLDVAMDNTRYRATFDG